MLLLTGDVAAAVGTAGMSIAITWVLSCHPAFPDAKTDGFDVQLMLEPVQDVVADGIVIAHRDQRGSLSSECFMTQPAERLDRLRSTLWIHGTVVGESLSAPVVVYAKLIDVLGGEGTGLFR